MPKFCEKSHFFGQKIEKTAKNFLDVSNLLEPKICYSVQKMTLERVFIGQNLEISIFRKKGDDSSLFRDGHIFSIFDPVIV